MKFRPRFVVAGLGQVSRQRRVPAGRPNRSRFADSTADSLCPVASLALTAESTNRTHSYGKSRISPRKKKICSQKALLVVTSRSLCDFQSQGL
jgi:hypothetical protein